LCERAGPLDRLLDALWRGDEAGADAILAAAPELVARAPQQALHQVADAARNDNLAAVHAMLRRGFPVTARSQHGGMPLHWAAFHGNAEMMTEILRHDPPLEARDRQFDATAMGWLIHGAVHGSWSAGGNHGACAHLLRAAGARVDEASLPTGNDDIDRVLRAHFVPG
jgi:hypothetical protein